MHIPLPDINNHYLRNGHRVLLYLDDLINT
jgi:hypothetical protein